MKKKTNSAAIKNCGDPWINRLTLIIKVINQMDDDERNATLDFIVSKFDFIPSN